MKSICFKFVVWLCSGACAFSIALAEAETDMAALLAKFNRLYATKQFSKAAPVAEKILQIREESQGPESRGTAAAANNLAEVYRLWASTRRPNRFINARSKCSKKSSAPSIPMSPQS